MMPSNRLVVLKSTAGILSLLSRPAAAALGTGRHVAQRAPAFVGRGPGLLHRTAHAPDLTDEVVQLRFDLIANAAPLLRQVQPSPHSTRDGPKQGCRQHTRSFVHV